ncbi:hypothetical protein DL96DRAFT_1805448 [Flagelloscypha sp. PMI_526]|nr:hypothetical protein DL96DRAFT_1805448 [Flagelloscypha sp. PMI_526]
MATPGTENVDKQAVGGVEATTGTDIEEELCGVEASSLKQDIEEREISNDASPSTSASTPAPAPAPTLCLMNPSQPSFAVLRPPSPALPPPPRDPEPELELVIEPVDDIEAEFSQNANAAEPLNLQLHSLHRASFHECPTPVGDGNGDGETTAAEDFELSKAESPKLNADGFGAADYDESADRREDAERALLHRTQDAMDVDEDEFEEVEEVVDDEDVDDMFASEDKKRKKMLKKVNKFKPTKMLPDGLDAEDDPEGLFAVVVKARVVLAEDGTSLPDAAPKREVVIKIMRSQETMCKSSQGEAALPAKLNAADPDDKRHVIHLERTFEWRGHLWKGWDVGLSVAAVNVYAIQIFLALSLFKKESITHADIKPDNILISNNKTTFKSLASTEPRKSFLGCRITLPSTLDLWAVPSSNSTLAASSSQLIKKAKFGTEYFDDLGAFFVDSSTGGDGAKVFASKAERDVKTRLLGGSGGETKEVRDLVDLIEKCLVLDSGRRITPKEALGHPFLKR